MERLYEKYKTPEGTIWEIWFVIYETQIGKDEVLQYKKNGKEIGHHTRHFDKNNRLLKENFHGITTIPSNAIKI